MQHRRLIAYADFACPFSRLAESVNDRLRRHGVTVEGAAFELRPAGTALPDPAAAWPRDVWQAEVEPLAGRLGIDMRRPERVVRTRKAHEAVMHAATLGRQDDMRVALYDAYWRAGRDIGRIDVLTEIGREIGLDASALRVALDIDRWTDAVLQDGRRAARLGLTDVPAYVRVPDGDAATAGMMMGLREFEELRAWVERDDI